MCRSRANLHLDKRLVLAAAAAAAVRAMRRRRAFRTFVNLRQVYRVPAACAQSLQQSISATNAKKETRLVTPENPLLAYCNVQLV